MTTIIQATDLKDVPPVCQRYTVDARDTEQDALRKFEQRMGYTPTTAYRWEQYLCIPVGEGVEK